MKFFYCTVCDHYHVDDDRLPCTILGKESKRTVLMADSKLVRKLRRKSQQMLNSRKVYLQTLKVKYLVIGDDK